MNILKIFRNKYLAFIIGITVLFYSCEIYDLKNSREFSYEIYENFKNSNIEFIELDLSNLKNNFKSKTDQDVIVSNLNLLVSQINDHFNTNVSIPDNILFGIYNNTTETEVKTFMINENLISQEDITIYENFVINSKTKGFDNAMLSFESDIINKNVNDSEFQNYNNIANSFKIMNNQDPVAFAIDDNYNLKSQGNVWWCLLYYVLWVISLVTWFAACAGPQAIFFCIAASINLVEKSYKVITNCAGQM